MPYIQQGADKSTLTQKFINTYKVGEDFECVFACVSVCECVENK